MMAAMQCDADVDFDVDFDAKKWPPFQKMKGLVLRKALMSKGSLAFIAPAASLLAFYWMLVLDSGIYVK
jgi:hypothetical protein